jgi:cell division protein FtsI/penicillin-binding protein 2
MQVNPLQVARFIAAIGNGGTLYKPQLVEKIVDPDNNPSFTFQPQAQSTLPVTPENLLVIQEAMQWVVSSPRGTAKRAFSGLGIPVYGKTGTAQNDWPGHPHAWFAGYTAANRSDRPILPWRWWLNMPVKAQRLPPTFIAASSKCTLWASRRRFIRGRRA